jgi:epoxyqueuosine reductase QueG
VIVEFDFAAQAAGLGEIGRGKWLLTPEFGPRQMLTMILTDAELEPDAPFAGHTSATTAAHARMPARHMRWTQ